MSVKVGLPKGVIEAIEQCEKSGISRYDMIALSHVTGKLFRDYDKETINALETIRAYGEMHQDKMLQALVNGYEIESSPEERIKEVYTKQSPTHPEGHPGYYKQLEICQAFQEGITFTLNTLNIEIEGVNAE